MLLPSFFAWSTACHKIGAVVQDEKDLPKTERRECPEAAELQNWLFPPKKLMNT
jgi:hypothetical protein